MVSIVSEFVPLFTDTRKFLILVPGQKGLTINHYIWQTGWQWKKKNITTIAARSWFYVLIGYCNILL